MLRLVCLCMRADSKHACDPHPVEFKQIAARLNGFSTPIFGVSWNPPTADRDVAHRVLTDLEARRVLYQDHPREVSEDVVSSRST